MVRANGPVRVFGEGRAGSRIRSRRSEIGFTQASLADALDVSRQTVVALESDDYAPSVFLAIKVARQLQLSVEEIWGLDTPP